ncbi:Bacterial SH3 domain protein [Pseudogemmobacter humi]|uniref:Bacterial SH3 domain protein n=2 Tax=Pseudogemmobacter humi TaxID=2483812 RepID=A0A3P5X210_9RHOB|nr:Bacterial SH3 domain protein [Pseudogemmobacter humi]
MAARWGLIAAMLIGAGPGHAQDSAQDTEAAIETAVAGASADAPAAARKQKECSPDIGCVTNLPLPRYVSLKGEEGNARRGPGLTHRIDWVFTRPGMPLKVTAEYENWRRVEDQDGAGGWVHYALLSGVRSVLITTDMAEFRDAPRMDARVIAQAELGVVARVLECRPDWCRISVSGERGWVAKTALWGVGEAEVID